MSCAVCRGKGWENSEGNKGSGTECVGGMGEGLMRWGGLEGGKLLVVGRWWGGTLKEGVGSGRGEVRRC